jgi:hypothetical protein
MTLLATIEELPSLDSLRLDSQGENIGVLHRDDHLSGAARTGSHDGDSRRTRSIIISHPFAYLRIIPMIIGRR